jgi:hypothetical protein
LVIGGHGRFERFKTNILAENQFLSIAPEPEAANSKLYAYGLRFGSELSEITNP